MPNLDYSGPGKTGDGLGGYNSGPDPRINQAQSRREDIGASAGQAYWRPNVPGTGLGGYKSNITEAPPSPFSAFWEAKHASDALCQRIQSLTVRLVGYGPDVEKTSGMNSPTPVDPPVLHDLDNRSRDMLHTIRLAQAALDRLESALPPG